MSVAEKSPTPPWRTLVLVGLGGALGVLARVGLLGMAPAFVVITVINIVGSFGLGLLAGLVSDHRSRRWAIPLLGTGFLGGFTTLSAVSAALVSSPDPVTVGLAFGQVLLGTGLAWTGLSLADRIRGVRR